MPLVQTRGAASAQGFGEFAQATVANYIEEVFSTYVYEGNGTTQQIVNGIDLSTKGGLVWTKSRSNAFNNMLMDTARTSQYLLNSNTTGAQANQGSPIANFNTDGYTFTASGSSWNTNIYTNNLYVGWTFRKQPKFFDIVTYTGTGVARTVAHNLGSVPGCIIVKETGSANDWIVYHRSVGNGSYLTLNSTAASDISSTRWNDTTPTSTVFTVGTNNGVNANGATYVAYLFAHDAGGFGLTGTDNVISCGTYTGNGGTRNVNLGYEPQWVMVKRTDSTGNWAMIDTMRSWTAGDSVACEQLYANLSNALTFDTFFGLTSTGFGGNNGDQWNVSSATYIYIAIRRGPMKVPTVGTSVYNAIARTGTSAAATVTGVGFAPDAVWGRRKDANYGRNFDRLRGVNVSLAPATTSGEATPASSLTAYTMDGFTVGADASEHINASSISYIYWNFKRAPGFFDIVCYTGNYGAQTLTHNLGVAPEMFILKNRAGGSDGSWLVYHSAVGNTAASFLNSNAVPSATNVYFNSTSPTSTTFTIGTNQSTGGGATYIAYLFATLAGVSKVGSYTGTGTTNQINCGFTAGARFVLIHRTDDTVNGGNWYIWDTVRGIISGNDPYLIINNVSGSPTAEVTNTDYIDPYSAGFELSSTAPAALNASGGTFIFLAIA
jgi:hypothetical protein